MGSLASGVAAGIIANWITNALSRSPKGAKAHMVIRAGGKEVEISLDGVEQTTLTDLVSSAIDRVHSNP